MKCIFCGEEIPEGNFLRARRGKGHLKILKYCSSLCTKRNWYYKNNPLSLDYKRTATYKGKKWEDYACNKLGEDNLNKNKFNNPGYDFLFNNIKIDVKSKNTYKKHDEWSFSRENKKPDLYLCFCLKSNKLIKTYLVKNNDFGKSGITIGKKSNKFAKYLIEFYGDTEKKTIVKRISEICE